MRLYSKAFPEAVPELSAEQIEAWLARDETLFRFPLFVSAAAINFVRDPEHRAQLAAAEVLSNLLARELQRMNEFSEPLGFGQHTVARLAALAVIREGIDGAALRRIEQARPEGFTFPPAAALLDEAQKLDWWRDGALQPLRPDILEAELVFRVLGGPAANPPEWLWRALQDASAGWLSSAERIYYDLSRIHGLESARQFSGWLASMVDGRLARAEAFRYATSWLAAPGTLPLLLAICRELLKQDGLDDSERASLLNGHSVDLSDAGKEAEALEAIKDAVEIYRRLAADNPARFEPDLALSLCVLGLRTEVNDWALAIRYFEDAIELFKKHEEATPGRVSSYLTQARRSLQRLEESGPRA